MDINVKLQALLAELGFRRSANETGRSWLEKALKRK